MKYLLTLERYHHRSWDFEPEFYLWIDENKETFVVYECSGDFVAPGVNTLKETSSGSLKEMALLPMTLGDPFIDCFDLKVPDKPDGQPPGEFPISYPLTPKQGEFLERLGVRCAT